MERSASPAPNAAPSAAAATAASGAAVEVRNLRKVFPGAGGPPTVAVDDVTFSCAPGEVLGLLGPNGAGKTTTLRILATILQPTSGTAQVGGADVVLSPDGVRRNLGYVSASTGVYERLTGRETLEYYGRLHGMDAALLARRADEVVKFLSMEDFADRLCGRLSSGQRQKVSLARAIIHDPKVLILDEPTANLDVLVARNVLEFVERTRAAGRAVLLSTHLFHEADRLCDRIVVIHRGAVLAAGTKDDLLARTGARTLEDAFFRLVQP